MKRHWQIRRQFQPTVDGAGRWDQGLLHLLIALGDTLVGLGPLLVCARGVVGLILMVAV